MFDFRNIFWILVVEYGTPVIATLFGWLYTALSGNRTPLWVTVPAYAMIHVIGLAAFLGLGLDGDWLKYLAWRSTGWWVVYYGPPVVSLAGLAWVLWVGLRKRPRRVARGFEVV